MQGYGVSATVLLTPLFFGLAHLHHLREHVVHQGHPLRLAAAMVRRRMCFFCCASGRLCKPTRVGGGRP